MSIVSMQECRMVAEQLVKRYGKDLTKVLPKYPEHVAEGIRKALRQQKKENK